MTPDSQEETFHIPASTPCPLLLIYILLAKNHYLGAGNSSKSLDRGLEFIHGLNGGLADTGSGHNQLREQINLESNLP